MKAALLILLASVVHAEPAPEGEAPAAPAAEAAPAGDPAPPAAGTPAAVVAPSGFEDDLSVAVPVPKPKRVVREKEAEGTQAINKNIKDAVIKSQYRLDGEPLEVDPN